MIKKIKSKTDEWYEVRSNGIGGSEVGTILGLNQYQSRVSLYNEKIGIEKPFESNIRMELGNYLEPFIVNHFAQETGLPTTLNKDDYFIHESGVIRGTPDAFYIDENGNKGVLEIKTTSGYINIEDPKDVHYIQLQTYLIITGLEFGKIVYLDATHSLKITETVYKDSELEQLIIEEVNNFWNDHVLKKIPPKPETTKDVNLLYPKGIGSKKADSKGYAMVKEYNIIKDKIKELKSQQEVLKDKIIVEIGENEALEYDGNVIATYKSQVSRRFDSKLFKKENSDIYSEYIKEDETRAFRTK